MPGTLLTRRSMVTTGTFPSTASCIAAARASTSFGEITMPVTPLLIPASTSAVCLGELPWPSAIMRSISPILFASSLAWLTMCTKNGKARLGRDIKTVRCFSAACTGPKATNANPRVATRLIFLLKYLIEFSFLTFVSTGDLGGYRTRTMLHSSYVDVNIKLLIFRCVRPNAMKYGGA